MAKRVVVGRITKPCEVCGEDVTRQASDFRERVFCSRKCYWVSPYHRETVAAANASRNPVDTTIVKDCEQCGAEIVRPRSQYRKKAFCSRPCREANRAATSVRQITRGGYALVYVGRDFSGATKNGHMLEHRKVMQEFLGRPLLPEENVHHKNGHRADNRLSNLELWSHSQPRGQRVADKLEWAREFIALYADIE